MTFAALAGHPLLQTVLYQHPNRICSGDDLATGAVGPNRTGGNYIDSQKYGGELLQSAAFTGDPATAARGLSIIKWAIDNLLGIDGTFAACPDNWHSTSLFCEATLRGLSVYEELRGTAFDAIVKICLTNVNWIMFGANPGRAVGDTRNLPYSHRRGICACLCLWAWKVAGDTRYLDIARQYLDAWLTLPLQGGGTGYRGTYQRKDHPPAAGSSQTDWPILRDGQTVLIKRGGAPPESWDYSTAYTPTNSGFDASYTMQSARFIACACSLLPADDTRIPRLTEALRLLCDFERRLIQKDGTISTSGSTRVGVDAARSGDVKTIDFAGVLQGYGYAAGLVDYDRNTASAQKVAKGKGWA